MVGLNAKVNRIFLKKVFKKMKRDFLLKILPGF